VIPLLLAEIVEYLLAVCKETFVRLYHGDGLTGRTRHILNPQLEAWPPHTAPPAPVVRTRGRPQRQSQWAQRRVRTR
jgi:hypothetical protein